MGNENIGAMGLCDTQEAETTGEITVKPWGDKGAHKIVVGNGKLECTFSSYGATLLSCKFPDQSGNLEEITLNCDGEDQEAYAAALPGSYYGAVPGRFANRIAKGKFELDGQSYTLATNNEPNHLHGGAVGFDKQIWKFSEITEHSTGGVGVCFELVSPDGQEGYPGTLSAQVSYVVTADDCLHMIYSGTTDKATPCNLTNHAYWNLSGNLKAPIHGHQLTIPSKAYLPVDDTSIPTGELKDVAGTPFDLTNGLLLTKELLGSTAPPGAAADVIAGFDHCYVVADDDTAAANHGLKLVAVAREENSGRIMTVRTDQPGVQFYTANYLSRKPEDAPHTEHNGFCLETQLYPDSPNQSTFPNSILKVGETYKHHTMHKFELAAKPAAAEEVAAAPAEAEE